MGKQSMGGLSMGFTLIGLLSFFHLKLCCGDSTFTRVAPLSGPNTEPLSNYFYYFAYGSNLLKKRMQMNCPTAKFYSTARLEGYRLDFNVTVSLWHGAVATIARDPASEVWGTVWLVHWRDSQHLDKQEGLGTMYYSQDVLVNTPQHEAITARTYREYVDPPLLPPWQTLPRERMPSRTYRKVIIFGAAESGLPLNYIQKLISIPDNGLLASKLIRDQLGYPFMD